MKTPILSLNFFTRLRIATTQYICLALFPEFLLSSSLILAQPQCVFAEEKPSSPTEKKEEHLIKWATVAPANTIWGDAVESATKRIKEKSGNQIKNIWYFGGVAGDEVEAVEKLKLNQIQGMALMTAGISKLAPELMVYSYPSLFQNYQEIECVIEQTWADIEKFLVSKGFVVIGWADVGYSIYFSKHNIRNFEDAKKVKAWTWTGLELDRVGAEAHGMTNFVTLPIAEVLNALQKGLVDTVYGTYYTTLALQWHTQIEFMEDAKKYPGVYVPSFTILRKDTYDSLPPELQKILTEEYGKTFPYLRHRIRANENQAMKLLLNRGIKLMDTDPEYMEKVILEAQSRFKKLAGEYYPAWFLQKIIKTRELCREKITPSSSYPNL